MTQKFLKTIKEAAKKYHLSSMDYIKLMQGSHAELISMISKPGFMLDRVMNTSCKCDVLHDIKQGCIFPLKHAVGCPYRQLFGV